jgi:hypothetical protein
MFDVVNLSDAAEQLRALAERVRRNVPRRRDPERFHMESSEIARGILDIAGTLSFDREPAPRKAASGRLATEVTIIGGRRIVVQSRKPFAICADNGLSKGK